MMKIYGRTSSSRSSTEVGTECEANGERERERVIVFYICTEEERAQLNY